MLLHYCQLIILDVLREHLFVKETQLLLRKLFCLSFLWLQGREKTQDTWAPAKPLSGQHSAAEEGARAREDLAWSPSTPLPQDSAPSKLSWTCFPDLAFKIPSEGSQLAPVLWFRGHCWSRAAEVGLPWDAKTFLPFRLRADLPEIIPKA